MRKGFIFTFDAALALIAVIIILGVAAQQPQGSDYGGASEQLHSRAADNAAIGFYKATAGTGSCAASDAFCECAVYYTTNLDPNDPLAQSQLQKNVFCEKI